MASGDSGWTSYTACACRSQEFELRVTVTVVAGWVPQLGHCAPTYSAVLALLIVGSAYRPAYASIPRASIYKFFLKMKQPCGGFCMHDGGETDVRGTYTVIAIATLLNMLTPQLSAGVVDFVLRCVPGCRLGHE